ncbi:DUF4186 domain-containing protein [Pantoea sp. B65]|uniref:DUF4186 domain-containing protein n=1 Tax=Pantoea sp. B65 TaxID=2813359 RepID=UPI0039B421DA
MTSVDDLFMRLSRSAFRQRFHLGRAEYVYCQQKGEALIRQHAADFVKQRLSAAEPANDGRQTPMRGHPVFIAQHATATCCRGCLSKWHAIPQHQALTAEQQAWVVAVIGRWIQQEMAQPVPPARPAKSKSHSDDNDNRQLDLL